MNPADLGLPDKFTAFRAGQWDIIVDTAASDETFNLLSIPTGGGKSLIYMAIVRLVGAKRALIATANKNLQQQLMRDFSVMGMVDIRGQNNYRCYAVEPGGELADYGHPKSSCDEGPCHQSIECSLRKGGCTYYDAVHRAKKSGIVVTNYQYLMTTNRYSDPDTIGEYDLLILDEAHALPEALSEFCSVRIDADELRQLLSMSIPPLDDDQETWVDWAKIAVADCRNRYRQAKLDIRQPKADRRKLFRLMRRLTKLGQGLAELSKAHKWRRTEPSSPDVFIPGTQVDWVAEYLPNKAGAVFSPVWAHAYAQDYVFKGVSRVIMVSATLQPSVIRYLGLPPDQTRFRDFPSRFDPKRRPLIHVSSTKVDRNMVEGQYRIWVNKIDAIIAKHPNERGIVHSRSYDRAAEIVRRSKHNQTRLFGHRPGASATREAVDRYLATPGAVIVSPALEEGYDFPDDACRFQIIAKVPFVDTRSAVMQARIRSDKTYQNHLTAQSIMQMTGRGMRSEDDRCVTYVVDDHFDWFWPATKRDKLFPEWFRRAYVRRESV